MTPTREETLQAERDAAAAMAQDARERTNAAMGWLTQNAPSAAMCVLESIVFGHVMPDKATLEGFARGDWARASEEARKLALDARLREDRDAALEEAAIQAIVLCANEGTTCKGCGFHDLAQNIRALKSKGAP